MREFEIIIEKGENNYSAYVLNLDGCIASGDTVEEVRELMKKAIEMHIKGMIEDGIPIPEDNTLIEKILVDVA